MQALFSMDMNGTFTEAAVDDYCRCFPPGRRAQPYFEHLITGVLKNRANIDAVIERYSNHWKINRMACVDRNILRLSVFELLYCPDIPAKVAINEAIDIGKKFGTLETGSFINGIIDSIRIAIEKKQIETMAVSHAPEAPPVTTGDGS